MQEVIEKAVEVLRRGGLILYPTDTVWGIGCDATNSAAVEKVYALKGSQDKKRMLVLVDTVDNVSRYTGRVPEVAWQLMEFATGPLTLILPGACGVAPELVPEENTLGVRVPDHEFCRSLLRKFRRPLVSTSANFSGEASPCRFGEINRGIIDGVDYVIPQQYEKGATGKPSSIVSIGPGGEVKVIRE
ncbi:MAG: threonylcarbamoyl-AMP synthase [Alistipes sp.]|nr:threonylcarbamoyl-AMP synthase [Alistipes sp.]